MTDDLITIEKLRELRDRIAVDVAAGNVGTVGFLNTEFEWKSATYVRQLLAQPAGSGGVVTCAMCDAQMEKAFGPVVYPSAAAPASPQGWLSIAQAPKSVSDGSRVAGIYLLGFIPDASLEDDQCKIDVIWWEPLLPNNAGKRGKWCASSFGDSVEVCPTHWMPLPAPPSSGDGRGVAK